eukprot:CAMPEP_0201624444 /NCGR_PEP_ID=MMETSP0493-20130528/635_1 /ASSEMBLY_ACC=CAM_ASM_000838 /TAXON_ID=420259 /ORGANISM="Thalassiosira gravida, Strain GMp14c1" /LENGTH=65 /DNA_ID=CAMNT_0048094293 /DNA_START=31 /DNA_END=228 /DNA_ORIENTATION=+
MNAAPRWDDDDDDDDDDDVVIIGLWLLLQWLDAHDCGSDDGDEVNALPPEERSRSESNAAVVVVA